VIEFVNFNVIAIGPVAKPVSIPATSRPSLTAVPSGHRGVYFAEAEGFVDCPIYWRDDLAAGTGLTGPAVIEEPFSLTVVHPGQSLQVDSWSNLVIRTRNAPALGIER
jgi:N-methylhydantoinase A